MSAVEMTIKNHTEFTISVVRPPSQALIGEWFKEDALPAKCKTESEELSHWREGLFHALSSLHCLHRSIVNIIDTMCDHVRIAG